MKKPNMNTQHQDVYQILLPIWSAKRIKELGADAVKILLYYDSRRTNLKLMILNMLWLNGLVVDDMAEDIPYFFRNSDL